MRYYSLQLMLLLGILCILHLHRAEPDAEAETKPTQKPKVADEQPLSNPTDNKTGDTGSSKPLMNLFSIHKVDDSGKPTDELSPIRIGIILVFTCVLILAILAIVGMVVRKK